MISSRLFAAFIFCSALGFNLPSTASDLPDIFLSSKRSNVAYDPFLNSNTNDTAAKTTTENITYSGRAVDKVIVNKRAHQMILIKNGKEVKKFWIALSDRPVGRKMYEGDRRTPEGTYILDYKKFLKSLLLNLTTYLSSLLLMHSTIMMNCGTYCMMCFCPW